MKNKKFGMLFFLGLLVHSTMAQSDKLDSLQNELRQHGAAPLHGISDTIRINILTGIGSFYKNSNPDSAYHYYNEAKEFADLVLTKGQLGKNAKIIVDLKKGVAIKAIGWGYSLAGEYEKARENYDEVIKITEKYINPFVVKELFQKAKGLNAATQSSIGVLCHKEGDYAMALEHYFAAQRMNEEIGNKNGQASDLGNIGGVYYALGNYAKALEYFFRALKKNEEIGNRISQSANLSNIGAVYAGQLDYEKALEYLFRALEINEELDNTKSQANNLSNIGVVYADQNKNKEALEYYFKSLKINEELGMKTSLAVNYGNIGQVYEKLEDYSSALKYYFMALDLNQELGNKSAISSNMGNIGSAYTKLNKLVESEKYLKDALEISTELEALDMQHSQHKKLSELYDKKGQSNIALIHFKQYIVLRDSIFSEENSKEIMQKEMQFKYDKKAAADSVIFVKEAEITKAEISKNKAELKAKKNQQYALFGGLFLVIAFAAFMYNRFKVTSKQKHIIELQKIEVVKQKEYAEHQKEIVQEKNKEITDSINYAKRIQEAILPSKISLVENLKNGFVLFKPKDVVSGDFYWLEKYENTVFFAAADCTGHGVPGAMVSVVCSNAISKALLEEGLTETGKLLDRTRELVIERFARSGDEVKDGMDISLCALQFETTSETDVKLNWSGANNPLWIIRKGSNQLDEIKADKQPIGKYGEPKPFTSHSFDLQKGDAIYIFTDGYQDQFGGDKGKKFKASKMKEILISIQDKSMDEQKEFLNDALENWKGSLEQVDDICVIGVLI